MSLRQFISKYTETIILVLLWIVVFINPLIVEGANDTIEWSSVFEIWGRVMPFFFLTLFNHFLLVPYLFFKNKKKIYFGIALVTLAGFSFLLSGIKDWRTPGDRRPHGSELMMGAPPREGLRPSRLESPERRPLPPGSHAPGQIPGRLNSLLIAFLILGFDTGLRIAFRWSKSEKEKTELERQQLKTELDFLKHQISPHFFMNTLNNIHALVDIDSEDAKKAIIRLSRMMRYLLYESENGLTTLQKEIEFTQSFLELMRIRFSEDRVKINAVFPEIKKEIKIPAFLFVSYIENAFKHGINPKGTSFIKVEFELNKDHLRFNITNSNFPVQQPGEINASGVGLVNARQRLDLLFQDRYQLTELSDKEEYSVNLIIPIDAT